MTHLVWSNDVPTGFQAPDKRPSGKRNYQGAPGLRSCPLWAGEWAPRFRLLDQHGRVVMLGALLAKGPVVLRFCRHEGTSSFFRELHLLAALNDDIEQRGATLAVLAAQPLHPHLADRDPAMFGFALLTDKSGNVARSYGLAYRLPAVDRFAATAADRDRSSKLGGGNRSAPATYVIDQGSIVAVAFVDLEGRSGMERDQMVMALECLGKRKNPHSGTPDGPRQGEKR
jgi:peroxiredoxin